jgi:protein-disulfide isomerase
LWSWWVRDPNPATETRRRARRRPARLPIEEVLKPGGALPEIVMGREDAPVTIVEYADLTCPACAAFHSKVLPALKEKYIDTGQVRLVFREFPTSGLSILASMALRCVEPAKAQPLISAMFARQRDWLKVETMQELRDKLFSVGQQVGLSRQSFEECVPASQNLTTDRQKMLYAELMKERERAHAGFGVAQTPTFFVNTTKLTGAGIEDFDKALEPLLKR